MRVSKTNYDFSGWATRFGRECSDGRIIDDGSFDDCDGKIVPVVWNHIHDDPTKVLGHALLERRPHEGMYTYILLNDETDTGAHAKRCVKHGDLTDLSIYANQLKQDGRHVKHGNIRELSLVLAGANPGAFIDSILAHGDDFEEAMVFSVVDPEFEFGQASENGSELNHSDMSGKKEEKPMAGKTVKEVVNSMTDEQKTVFFACLAEAAGDGEEGGSEMKQNAFNATNEDNDVLIHDALNEVFKESRKYGSLRESYLAHAQEYGIENIDFMNYQEKDYYDRPQFINNQPTGWIQVVMNGVHHTPFAKVRTVFADITEDEARAKGYIKGKYKKEEVFKLAKRSVSAVTIYKKQKFDKDDLTDLSFDALPWVKQEMEVKFNEEKARAYIFGDGRSAADEDKIDESHIIPVVADNELFTITAKVVLEPGESLEHGIIRTSVLAQDDYEGSGNTIAFIAAKQVSKMLLMEDQFGHRLYKNLVDLASAMGVGQICKVPGAIIPSSMYGVIVDLSDYNVGHDKGGEKSFFDDFDIDYNQMKFLLEERQSGALVKPHSAIILAVDDTQ